MVHGEIKQVIPLIRQVDKMQQSKVRALTIEEFIYFLDFCKNSLHPLENTFLVIVTGRLGMREGEVAHMRKNWVDFEQEIIYIPSHEPCTCKYCMDARKKEIENRKKPAKKGKKKKKGPLKKRWSPKTPAGARAIPFGFLPDEAKDIIEEMLSKYPIISFTPIAISHRITRLAKKAGLDTGPHPLRAAALTYFAYKNVGTKTIQDIAGWETLEQAEHYIKHCGFLAKKELNEKCGEPKSKNFKNIPVRKYHLSPLGRKLIERKRGKEEDKWLMQLIGDTNCGL